VVAGDVDHPASAFEPIIVEPGPGEIDGVTYGGNGPTFGGSIGFERFSTLRHFSYGVRAGVLAVTKPDKPKGRGLHLSPSPVKEFALQSSLEILQPKSLKNKSVQERLASVNADFIVVVAYGKFLPTPIIDLPKFAIMVFFHRPVENSCTESALCLLSPDSSCLNSVQTTYPN